MVYISTPKLRRGRHGLLQLFYDDDDEHEVVEVLGQRMWDGLVAPAELRL